MNSETAEYWKSYFGAMNLSLGSSANHSISKNGQQWVNLDMNAKAKPDVLHNLNDLPMPFADNTFDCVLATHIFEHLGKEQWIHALADVHRILKPDRYLIAVTPHGSSDVALGMAQHKQAFFECTWNTVSEECYTRPDNNGYLDDEGLPFRKWELINIFLVPWPEYINDPDLEYKAFHGRNYINEMHAILRAVK